MKKKLIYKENSGTVTKIKLRKFKKHNQLYFGALVFVSYGFYENNA